jgi:hypothetical protein
MIHIMVRRVMIFWLHNFIICPSHKPIASQQHSIRDDECSSCFLHKSLQPDVLKLVDVVYAFCLVLLVVSRANILTERVVENLDCLCAYEG